MKKKITALSICAAMLIVAVVGGTLAYFTDTTDEYVNEFTVGDVDIELEEPDWDPDEDHILEPGVNFDKNPTITVQNDSEDAWLFLEVTIDKPWELANLMALAAGCTDEDGNADVEALFNNFLDREEESAYLLDWFTGIAYEDWTIMNEDELELDENTESLTLVLGYNYVKSAGDEVVFMTDFHMPANVTSEMIDASGFTGDFNLGFIARAIQASELKTLADAYAALYINYQN